MKKLMLLFTFVLLASGSTILAENTGCGLGTQMHAGKSGKVSEIMAVTTNGTSASQYFAITSGTSGYKENAVIGYNDIQLYIDDNIDMLASDMSKGAGEHLDTLGEMLKVDSKSAFNDKMRNNFTQIYTSENITSSEVLANILKVQKG